jgi:excisionase family DNA binding protein
MPACSTSAEPRFLGAGELAEFLGVHRATVWRMVAADMLPTGTIIGHRRRWDRQEILEWAAAGAPSREEWEAMKQAAAAADSPTTEGR